MTIPTPNLAPCLQSTPWRRLIGIIASLGLRIQRGQRKPEVIASLYAHLSQETVLRSIIAQVDSDCHAALAALVRAEGAVPAHVFIRRFGAVRPYRPWDKVASREKPWFTPASTTERLWWLGLVYLHPPRPQPGAVQHLIIPTEILALLARLLQLPAEKELGPGLPRPGQPADLLWHLSVWLATLAEEAIRPLHGHWLPPRVLATLASRTALDQDSAYRPSRSERELPYLAFLHYLAEAADLIHGVESLQLTPLAWDWLADATPTRWERLWQAWRLAPSALAQPYRFAWEPLSPQARTLVLTEIARLPSDRFVQLRAVVQTIRLQDARGLLPEPSAIDESEQDPVAALCCGPLFWFGVVELTLANTDLRIRLSQFGAWLLHKPGGSPLALPASRPCLIRKREPDVIVVPLHVQPVHLARLVRYCLWEVSAGATLEQRLRLDPARVAQAAAQGVQLTEIVQDLEAALECPTSRRQRQRLRRWAAAGTQVRIYPLLVLEARDPVLMTQLRQRKLVRRRLNAAISPTRSAVDPQDAPALMQTLRTLGYFVELPAGVGDAAALDVEPIGGDTPPPGLVWMLLQIYQGLGEHVDLPVKPPHMLEDRLRQQLSPMQRAAAETAVGKVLAQVASSLAGYLRVPAWRMPEICEDFLPRIEQAIARRQDLQITYWGGGGGTTQRRVTPYRLETQGSVVYLTAYCHLREQERVFRIDRIETCALVEQK